MSQYEVVIHAKGSKGEIVSPETYEYEEAERQLNVVREKIGKDEDVPLSWFAGTGSSVIVANVRPAEAPRSRAAPLTTAQFIEKYRDMGVIVDEPKETLRDRLRAEHARDSETLASQ